MDFGEIAKITEKEFPNFKFLMASYDKGKLHSSRSLLSFFTGIPRKRTCWSFSKKKRIKDFSGN
jgi:hypothetical protein